MIKIIAATKSDLRTKIRNKNRAESNLCDNFSKHFRMVANLSVAVSDVRITADAVHETPSRLK